MTDARPVLVTGAAGLIGGAVLEELTNRHLTPVALDVAAPDTANAPVEIADVCDLDALADVMQRHRPRAVIHLAAMVGVDTDRDPHRATAVNVMGTSNVLEAARTSGITRVVVSSSIMRETGAGLPHTGGSFPAPRNLYGAHKLVAEMEAEVYRERYGLDPVVVAIAGTLGAGRRIASAARAPHLHLLQCVAAGKPARLEADPRWRLPLRRTAAIAHLLVGAATAVACERFYHAGGRLTSLDELVATVRALVPHADVEFLGGSWLSLPHVASDAAARDFGLVEESVEEMVAATLAALRCSSR